MRCSTKQTIWIALTVNLICSLLSGLNAYFADEAREEIQLIEQHQEETTATLLEVHSTLADMQASMDALKAEQERLKEQDRQTHTEDENHLSSDMVMEVTAYTVSADECGNADGITSSGRPALVGRTVACNNLPTGTRIWIEGIGERIVEDTGGMGDNVLDVLVATKDEAYQIGRKKRKIKIL